MMRNLELTGKTLTFEDFEAVIEGRCTVSMSEEGIRGIQRARDLIFDLDKRGVAVYGLNTGVGWNKDKKVFAAFYDQYNRNLLRSHSIGIGPTLSEKEVRGVMLLRLNGFLCGRTGVAMEVAERYCTFLNAGIHPVMYQRASVGQGDIGILPAIGLVIIGEGEAYLHGERMSGAEALKRVGLEPLLLGPKDGLSIVSSNAYSSAMASVGVLEARQFLEVYKSVWCLALEGFNGVVSPLGEAVNAVRGYAGQHMVAQQARECLKGSYLFDEDSERALQDPLSFRNFTAILGAIEDAFGFMKQQLLVELNATDDNPCMMPEDDCMYVSNNFETAAWVFPVEMCTIAFGHLSKMLTQQVLRLGDPSFTKLNRFLTPEEGAVIAYGTIQKTVSILDTENRNYANPSSMDFIAMAGDIEDMSTNAAYAVDKFRKVLDNLYYMTAILLMHGAQAVDLRQVKKFGTGTGELYKAYRQVVPFLEKDRNLSIDIEKTYAFLKAQK